jgi:hypothetical protein
LHAQPLARLNRSGGRDSTILHVEKFSTLENISQHEESKFENPESSALL